MYFGCAPCAMSRLAYVWRRSWNRIRRRPDRRSARAQSRLVKFSGSIGVPFSAQKTSSLRNRLGSRASASFTVRATVNCGVLTRELLPSEFFGHERGAFTGAIASKPGLLEVTDGGTLFLDAVGELSADALTTLLRFLQNGEIRAVGSTRTMRVDVRPIAATNRDLEAAIAERTFREDLYYRLSDVVLEVPPLRERREDIPLLAEHFRTRFNEQYRLAIDPLGPETLSSLASAPWRGNVRELEKALKVAMIFRRGGALRPDDLRVRGHALGTRSMGASVARSLLAGFR